MDENMGKKAAWIAIGVAAAAAIAFGAGSAVLASGGSPADGAEPPAAASGTPEEAQADGGAQRRFVGTEELGFLDPEGVSRACEGMLEGIDPEGASARPVEIHGPVSDAGGGLHAFHASLGGAWWSVSCDDEGNIASIEACGRPEDAEGAHSSEAESAPEPLYSNPVEPGGSQSASSAARSGVAWCDAGDVGALSEKLPEEAAEALDGAAREWMEGAGIDPSSPCMACVMEASADGSSASIPIRAGGTHDAAASWDGASWSFEEVS